LDSQAEDSETFMFLKELLESPATQSGEARLPSIPGVEVTKEYFVDAPRNERRAALESLLLVVAPSVTPSLLDLKARIEQKARRVVTHLFVQPEGLRDVVVYVFLESRNDNFYITRDLKVVVDGRTCLPRVFAFNGTPPAAAVRYDLTTMEPIDDDESTRPSGRAQTKRRRLDDATKDPKPSPHPSEDISPERAMDKVDDQIKGDAPQDRDRSVPLPQANCDAVTFLL